MERSFQESWQDEPSGNVDFQRLKPNHGEGPLYRIPTTCIHLQMGWGKRTSKGDPKEDIHLSLDTSREQLKGAADYFPLLLLVFGPPNISSVSFPQTGRGEGLVGQQMSLSTPVTGLLL